MSHPHIPPISVLGRLTETLVEGKGGGGGGGALDDREGKLHFWLQTAHGLECCFELGDGGGESLASALVQQSAGVERHFYPRC